MTAAEKRAKAREMYAQKPQPTLREIAEEIDVCVGTAHRYTNPEADERYRIEARERRRKEAPPLRVAQTTSDADQPQHMRALAVANEVRLARAVLKRRIFSGETTAVAVLEEVPSEAESMPVMELLTAQRQWGRTRSRKALVPLKIGERKSLGSLTRRQRRLLMKRLGGDEEIDERLLAA